MNWVADTQQKFISYNLRGWKSEIRVPPWVGSGESPVPGSGLLTPRGTPHGEKRVSQLALWAFLMGA